MALLGAIWAQTAKGIIGGDEGIPWDIPEDLAHFRETTMGSPVIMGSTTWESLPEKPLAGRENYIVSSREAGNWSQGATVVNGVPDLDETAWVIGGGKVYRQVMPYIDLLDVTIVDYRDYVNNAVFAPRINRQFTLVSGTEWRTSSSGVRYKFQRYERRPDAR